VTLNVSWPSTVQSTGPVRLDVQMVSQPGGLDGSEPYFNPVTDVVANSGWIETGGASSRSFQAPGALLSGSYRFTLWFDGFPYPFVEIASVYNSGNQVYNWAFVEQDFGHIPAAPTASPKRPLWSKTPQVAGLQLMWDNAPGYEMGYLVERSSDGGTTWAQVANLPADELKYEDTSVTDNVVYQYRISSYTFAGVSAPLVAVDPKLYWRSTPSVTYFVNSNTGNDTANTGLSALSAFASLPYALQVAQDEDTIFLAGGDTLYLLYPGHAYLDKRVQISGGWDTSFAVNNPLQYWVKLTDGMTVKNVAYNITFSADVSGLTIAAPPGAEFAWTIDNCFFSSTGVRVIPPENHPMTGGGLLARGPGYQLTLEDLKIEYPNAPYTYRRHIFSRSASLTLKGLELLTAPGALDRAGWFRGIESVEGGSLVLDNALIDVGSDTSLASNGVGILVSPNATPGMVTITKSRFFLRGVDSNSGKSDAAIVLAGTTPYQPLISHNYFSFTNSSSLSPLVGIIVDGTTPAPQALIFNNVFVAQGMNFDIVGIRDSAANTRIFNNTFSAMPSGPGTQNFIGLQIVEGGHPHIVNNLFAGYSAYYGSPVGVGVDRTPVNNTTNPQRVQNNAFVAQGWRNGGLTLTSEQVNQEMETTLGVPGSARGNFYTSINNTLQYVAAADRYGYYGLGSITPPRVRYGGKNLTTEVTTWGGPAGSPEDIKTDFDPVNRRSNNGAAPDDPWSIGADENNDADWNPWARWDLNSNATEANNRFISSNFHNPEAWSLSEFTRPDRSNLTSGATFFRGRNFHVNAGSASTVDPEDFDAGWSVSLYFGDRVATRGKEQVLAASQDGNWIIAITHSGEWPELSIKAGPYTGQAPLPFWTLYRKWNHLLVVFNRAQEQLAVYLNGNTTPLILVNLPDGANFAYSPNVTLQALLLGASNLAGDNAFYGKLDEVKLYNRPLGASELWQFANGTEVSWAYDYAAASGTLSAAGTGLPSSQKLTWGTLGGNAGFLVKWVSTAAPDLLRGLRFAPKDATFMNAKPLASALDPGIPYTARVWPFYNNGTQDGNLMETTDPELSAGLLTTTFFQISPNSSMKALWDFGDARGYNLMAPTDPLQALSGNNGDLWWDPDRTTFSSTTGSPISPLWANDRINTGSVWFGGSTYLQTGLSNPGFSPDGATNYAVVVRFALASAMLPGQNSTLFKIDNGSQSYNHLHLYLTHNSNTSLALSTMDGLGATVTKTFPLLIGNLTPGYFYTVLINYFPGGSSADFWVSDGTSGTLSDLPWNVAQAPAQIRVGFSSSGNFKGWIDEVRIYRDSGPVDTALFNALVNE
jgi:hypothetical protein